MKTIRLFLALALPLLGASCQNSSLAALGGGGTGFSLANLFKRKSAEETANPYAYGGAAANGGYSDGSFNQPYTGGAPVGGAAPSYNQPYGGGAYGGSNSYASTPAPYSGGGGGEYSYDKPDFKPYKASSSSSYSSPKVSSSKPKAKPAPEKTYASNTTAKKKSSAGGSVMKTSYNTGRGSRTHTVKRGETLYSISRSENTTVERLMSRNNITNPNRIGVGEKLVVD